MANAFNLTAQLNLQGPANITSVVNNIRKQLGNINANVNVVINPNTNRNITALNSSFQTFNRTLRDTRTVTRDAASAITALGRAINQAANPLNNLNVNLRNNINATAQLAQNLQNTNRACNQAGSAFEAFGRQAGNAIRRAAAFSTVAGLVYKLGNSFNAASKEFIEFNKELVRVAQVTDTNLNNLGSLVKQITELSTSLGVSSSELIKVSSTLAQAGLSAKDTEKALKAVARSALAPSFDSMNDTVEGSIALMRQFGIEAGQLENALGSINAVSAKFAVEASDLITAIQRTGGVFASASKGVSSGTDALNEFLAIFTSIRATTRESAETIATGLRTIFARIQRSETIENLQRFGVLLTDLEGKFVGPYEAVRRLSEGLSRLDPRDLRFAEIVEELGGFRQIGKVIPLIQQFAVSQQALKVAQSGQASLAKDIAVAQESVANKITKVREEFIALIRSIGESQNFQTFVKLSLDLASALIKLADAAKNVLPAIAAVTAIRSIGPAVQYGRGFIGGLTGRARRNNGGPIGFASGGFVPGQGNSDTVPAMLTPGEFVIRKKAVQALGVENLHRVNKYSGGGRVKRNIGYIDSDVMADPANASIVRAEMERLGISDVHKYKLHISTLAANKRKSGDIKKLTTVYGAAGSGKSTLSQGGSRGSQSDNATLRQTIRYPILTEADILKSDQIIDLTSVAGPNQKVFLSASDRIIGLSSRTKESQEILKQNRMSRDRTGVGLFGRKIGATKSAPLDSGMGEAYIAAKDVSGVDPKKVITYKIGSNFSRSRTNQPNVRSPEKIGLFYGNFGPTTAGHLSVVEEAKKLGIKPSDFIALIGGDTPIDFSNKDEHSRRTAIMPQMSRVGPSRLGMAKATFGAMGANVSPMPKGSSPGSIPSAFKVGDDSYIVPKGINDIAFVGDEKEEKSLEKYSKLGYSVKSLPRISNISGTAAREAIMNNDIAAMKKLLSPEGFKYIQDNLAIIQQRPILLDSILEHFQKNSQQGRGLSGRLGSIKDELSNLPGRITKTTPPEISSKIEILRKKRDEFTAKLGRRPARMLEKIESLRNIKRYNNGGSIQKFSNGGASEEIKGTTNATKNLTLEKAIEAGLSRGALSSGFGKAAVEARLGPAKQAGKLKTEKLTEQRKSDKFKTAYLRDGMVGGLFLQKGKGGTKKIQKILGRKGEEVKDIPGFPGVRRIVANVDKAMLKTQASGKLREQIEPAISSAVENASVNIIKSLEIPPLDIDENIAASDAVKRIDLRAIEGHVFEALISKLSGTKLSERGATFDFVGANPNNIKRLNQIFDEPVRAPFLDAKRTLNSESMISGKSSIANKIVAAMRQGKLDRKHFEPFANGGSPTDTVPALLTPGEFVINKKAASRIGLARLHELNRADKIQGFAKGGNVQRFVRGGTALADIGASNPRMYSQITSAVGTSPDISKAFQDLMKQLDGLDMPLDDAKAAIIGWTRAINQGKNAEEAHSRATSAAAKSATNFTNKASGSTIATGPMPITTKQSMFPTFSGIGGGNAPGSKFARGRRLVKMRQGLRNMGGMGGLAISMGGSAAVEGLSSLMGGEKTEAGRRTSAIGGDVMNYATLGAGIGSMFGIFGTAIGGAAGALVGLTTGFINAEKAVQDLAKEQAQEAKERQSEMTTKAMSEYMKSPSSQQARTRVLSELKATGQKEAKLTSLTKREKTESIPQYAARIAKAEEFGAEKAREFLVNEMMRTGKTFAEYGATLNPADAAMLTTQIVQGDEEFQRLVASVQETRNSMIERGASEQQIAQYDRDYADILNKQGQTIFKRIMAEDDAAVKAKIAAEVSAKLAIKLEKSLLSLETSFDTISQVLNKTSFQIDALGKRAEDIISGKEISRGMELQKSINILQNPSAYSEKERIGARSKAGASLGSFGSFTANLATAGERARNEAIKISASMGGGAAPTENQKIAKGIIGQVETIVNQLGLAGSNIGRDTMATLKDTLEKQVKEGEQVNYEEIINQALAPLIKGSEKANDILIKAAQQTAQAYGELQNVGEKIADLEQEKINRTTKLREMQSSQTIAQKEALGIKVTPQERINQRSALLSSRLQSAVGKPGQIATVKNIDDNITGLEQQRSQVVGRLEELKAGPASEASSREILNLEIKAKSISNSISAASSILEDLPESLGQSINDINGAIQDRVQKLESTTQAGTGFIEKLVTSTPQEIQSLNNSFSLMRNTLNGQLTTIQQSTSAQQAYYESLNRGSSVQEAMMAAQSAYANETRNALSMFDEMTKIAGVEGPELDQMRAKLLENFARAQGMGVENNPMVSAILAKLKQTPQERAASDPVLIKLQEQSNILAAEQQKAIQAINDKTSQTQAQLLGEIGSKLIAQLDQVKIDVEVAIKQTAQETGQQVPNLPLQPENKKRGGLIYASKGTLVNFQPKGTDTVPAMLSPGEFVVNARSTREHLPLLQSINRMNGGIANAVDPKMANTMFSADPYARFKNNLYRGMNPYQEAFYRRMNGENITLQDVMDERKNISKYRENLYSERKGQLQKNYTKRRDINKQLFPNKSSFRKNTKIFGSGVSIGSSSIYASSGGIIGNRSIIRKPKYYNGGGMNEATGTSSGGVLNIGSIEGFAAKLDEFVVKLQNAIPSTINVQGKHDVNVIINGAGILQNVLGGPIGNIVEKAIINAFAAKSRQNEGSTE